jgi:hypothetical protein
MFYSEEKLDTHCRDQNLNCKFRPRESSDGFGHEKERLLRNRKEYYNLEEIEKWKKMYGILFPSDSEFPSPCIFPSITFGSDQI